MTASNREIQTTSANVEISSVTGSDARTLSTATADTLKYSVENSGVNQGAQGTFYGPVTVHQVYGVENPRDLFEPPPLPLLPPDPIVFVGRADELVSLGSHLVRDSFVIIMGMPGIGKTALAAVLARQHAAPDYIFWHTFSSGERLESLLWHMGAWLANQGQNVVWEIIQHESLSKERVSSHDQIISYIIPLILHKNYLICLDNVSAVEDQQLLGMFIDKLRPEMERGSVKIVVTSRSVPIFAHGVNIERLAGISLEDAYNLVYLRGSAIENDYIRKIHLKIGGNPQLLMLAINAIDNGNNPELLIKSLFETVDVEMYLLREFDAYVMLEERRIMQILAILLEEGGDRHIIEYLFDNGNIRRLLRSLHNRSLIHTYEGVEGNVFYLHSLLQAFYYDEMSPQERKSLHARAASFYEATKQGCLFAAIHYERADQPERATDLILSEIWPLISMGRGRMLSNLLERLIDRKIDETRWIAVNLMYGQILQLGAAIFRAKVCYESVIERIAGRFDAPERRMFAAQACRGMGEVLEFNDPKSALVWFSRGFNLIKDLDIVDRAVLLRKIGSVLMLMGSYKKAEKVFMGSLSYLKSEELDIRSMISVNLGHIACSRGDMDKGVAYFENALEICQRNGYRWREVSVRQNIGNVLVIRGCWDKAAGMYHKVLDIARDLGFVAQKIDVLINLGFLYTRQGLFEEAHRLLLEALSESRSYSLKEQLACVLLNLVGLYLRWSRWGEAYSVLRDVDDLVSDLDLRTEMPETFRYRVLLNLNKGKLVEALADAEQAVSIACELQDPFAEGASLRVRAQVFLLLGRFATALADLERSAELLEHDPYEQACTLAIWGLSLLPTNSEVGKPLIKRAYAIFRSLGAKADLENIEHLVI